MQRVAKAVAKLVELFTRPAKAPTERAGVLNVLVLGPYSGTAARGAPWSTAARPISGAIIRPSGNRVNSRFGPTIGPRAASSLRVGAIGLARRS